MSVSLTFSDNRHCFPLSTVPILHTSFLCLLFLPENAWALQSHGPPEGLYVHQMAHIFFFLALVYLFWDIRRSSFSDKGWRYIEAFCGFMIVWNVVAFIGHGVAAHISQHLVPAPGYLHSRIQGPVELHEIVYYITKFDHLLAVPALFCLCVGMRALCRSSIEEDAGEADK